MPRALILFKSDLPLEKCKVLCAKELCYGVLVQIEVRVESGPILQCLHAWFEVCTPGGGGDLG